MHQLKKGGWMEKLENYSKQQQAQVKASTKRSKK